MSDTLRVWHFAASTLRDGRPLPKRGDILIHTGPVVPCKQGLHGSVRALDALNYAPGPWVSRPELRGTIVPHSTDKHAASERHYLTDYVDATRVLYEFACWCATQALDREEAAGRKVDPRSRAGIATKLAWLDGNATNAELTAARDAAWDAARTTALTAARSAALNAAWSAAWTTSWDAAWDAALTATWPAKRTATWNAQNTELERRLNALIKESDHE